MSAGWPRCRGKCAICLLGWVELSARIEVNTARVLSAKAYSSANDDRLKTTVLPAIID